MLGYLIVHFVNLKSSLKSLQWLCFFWYVDSNQSGGASDGQAVVDGVKSAVSMAQSEGAMDRAASEGQIYKLTIFYIKSVLRTRRWGEGAQI